MNALAYYVQQSIITDPGDYAHLYADMPDDIAEICRIAQGLINHYAAPDHGAAPDRMGEIDCRYLRAMLDRILELDERPLREARPVEKRLVGCCRDFTVLTVSILRHKGIPARARYGTGAYFEAGYFHDHVIVEYWDGKRWVGVDSQLRSEDIRHWNISFDPLDVPDDQFLRAGKGWLMCRSGAADPDRFGLGSKSPIRGSMILVTEMLLDLAALNRLEMLCWDSWGMVAKSLDLSGEDNTFLDRIARATLDESRFEDWQQLYRNERLRIPDVIESYSPAVRPEEMPLVVRMPINT